MADIYRQLELEQGSDAWHAWRAGGIGGSDASIVRGDSHYKDVDDLRFEKRNPELARKKARVSAAAREGIALEAEARRCFEDRVGVQVEPACLERVDKPWMRCSLDGICLDSGTLVEIKCGLKTYQGVRRYRRIPPWYYAQLQHNLAVSGFRQINFFVYRPQSPPINIVCERDDWYIRKLEEQEEAFWRSV